jgi:hypothetical protein
MPLAQTGPLFAHAPHRQQRITAATRLNDGFIEQAKILDGRRREHR